MRLTSIDINIAAGTDIIQTLYQVIKELLDLKLFFIVANSLCANIWALFYSVISFSYYTIYKFNNNNNTTTINYKAIM